MPAAVNLQPFVRWVLRIVIPEPPDAESSRPEIGRENPEPGLPREPRVRSRPKRDQSGPERHFHSLPAPFNLQSPYFEEKGAPKRLP